MKWWHRAAQRVSSARAKLIFARWSVVRHYSHRHLEYARAGSLDIILNLLKFTHTKKNNSQNACMRRRKIRLMMFWISKSEIWTLMLSPGVGIEFHTNTHSYTHLDRSTTAKKESWTWTWISQMKHDAAACLWNMSNLRNCNFRFDHHPPELSNLSLTELFVIVIDRSRPLNLSHYIVLRLIVCMFHDVNQFNAPCEDFSIIDWILYCLLDKSWAFN